MSFEVIRPANNKEYEELKKKFDEGWKTPKSGTNEQRKKEQDLMAKKSSTHCNLSFSPKKSSPRRRSPKKSPTKRRSPKKSPTKRRRSPKK